MLMLTLSDIFLLPTSWRGDRASDRLRTGVLEFWFHWNFPSVTCWYCQLPVLSDVTMEPCVSPRLCAWWQQKSAYLHPRSTYTTAQSAQPGINRRHSQASQCGWQALRGQGVRIHHNCPKSKQSTWAFHLLAFTRVGSHRCVIELGISVLKSTAPLSLPNPYALS